MMMASCARINNASWFLFMCVTLIILPIASTSKKLRRFRRSGPNLCGGGFDAQCCTGWQPAGVNPNLCIKPICSFNCGSGICVRPNSCVCEDGKYSPTCTPTNKDCSVRCYNGGTCKDDKCQCAKGFVGRHCENAVCNDPCLNGGKCIGPDRCACLYGFGGPTCQEDYRQGPCYKEIKDRTCKGQVTTLICTKELCCATIGKAWGIPCQLCPSKPDPCTKGYLPDYQSRECLDIDECKAIPDLCDVNGKCINTPGSYTCEKCDVGFKYDDRTNKCEDVDECADRLTNRCLNGRCKNSIGGFRCLCDEGFILSEDGSYCEKEGGPRPTTPVDGQDLCFKQISQNSCLEPLSVNVTKMDCCCSSIRGAAWSRVCQPCPYVNTDDYNNLCQLKTSDGCKVAGASCPNGICEDRSYGLECVCKKGFNIRSADGLCVDIDECASQASICANSVCRNTIGSFVCDCKIGFLRSNPLLCELEVTPTNPSGIGGQCSREGEKCPNGICSTVNGFLQCTCNSGYQYDENKCVDRNECDEDSDICQNGICVNRNGGYECDCASGYKQTRDKQGCTDVDECKVDVCENGQCTNTIGGWRCSCNKGFALSFDEKSCIDINECTSLDDVCTNGVCVNTAGDFYCRCNSGYSPSTNRHMCLDSMQSQCYASYSNNVCSNTLFRPLTISQCCCGVDNTADNPRGWGNPCRACPIVNTDAFKKVCIHGPGKDSGGKDIDECSNNVGGQIDLCAHGRCGNTNGDYYCECDDGYRSTADGKKCREVDECQENPSLCHRGRCENVPGSYRCVCTKGYVFSPKTKGCEDENECTNPNQCIDGTCINRMGSFRCQCPSQLTLHVSGRICEDLRKAKCWRKFANHICEDNVNGDVTRQVCCQTLGLAWGSPCEKCPPSGKCRVGYAYQNFTCVDIDECESFSDICRNGLCVNTVGSYQCECSEGLTLDESKSVCLDQRENICFQSVVRDKCTKPVRGLYKKDICCCSVGVAWSRPCEECPLRHTREFDDLCRDNGIGPRKNIDECTVFPGICANGECIDSIGSFMCKCRFGFDLDETGKNCTDINECGLTLGLCGNGTCVNIPGGFRCNCQRGFKNAPMMMEICIDIDECADLTNPCQGGTCINTVGSFKCQCPLGKRMDPSGLMCQDINECSEDPNICPNGICQNFMGGYQCACHRGFNPTDDMKNCVDINECETEKGWCEEGCRNTRGSFVCLCSPGHRLRIDKRSCVDIDECVETPDICGVENQCRNVLGGHLCACTEAYILSEDRKSCIDIDECESDPDICLNGKCRNILGSYECECGVGYKIAVGSTACVDVNECEGDDQKNCGRNSYCVNSVGSYSCTCQEGFEKSDDGCTDVNECTNGDSKCGENAVCSNTNGGHACVCNEGYQGDGTLCIDVDECNERPSVCANGNCMNAPGSYVCDCDFGYLPTVENDGCIDVDECSAFEELCDHGTCLNIPGSFQCVCDKGFQLNRYKDNCTDMNECNKTGMCLNGRCLNEMGHYRCECDEDFVPNKDKTACIDTRTGQCFLRKGSASNVCSRIVSSNILRAYCCCSVGEAWNDPCEDCPVNGTESFRHLCPSIGFVVNPVTTSLLDINECAFPYICVGGICKNTLGSFKCTCSVGYEYNPRTGTCNDINECTSKAHICGWTGVCINTIGSYRCECLPGESAVGLFCVDLRNHDCYGDVQNPDDDEGSSPGTSCKKKLTPKLFTRTKCCCTLGTAYGDPDMCKACPLRNTDEFKVLCPRDGTEVVIPTSITGPRGGIDLPPVGTQAPPTVSVTDVNECTSIPNLCIMGICINTYGSFRCTCHKGFKLHEDGTKCEDENECLLSPCKDGVCKNTFGSFMCTCGDGYTVDETGLTCVDHNECHANGTCANGKCVNLVGDYRCLCNRGFKLANRGKACEDLNECLNHDDICGNGTCVNKVGTYGCRCDKGFRENDRRCQDIDECLEQPNEVCRNGLCINSFGSFSCQCKIGYILDHTKRNCRDINECNEVQGYCQDGDCVNTIGGSRCECSSNGYKLHPTGDRCVDINECDEDPNLCKMHGQCVNTPGIFYCICPKGYKAANGGKMCVDMRSGYCFDSFDNRGCSVPRMKNVTKSVCCCTKGAGWGDPCETCPPEQTATFALLCPKGVGYAVQVDKVEDINECEKNPALCRNGRCINNDGSYRCQCFAGFVLDDSGRNCKDKNECNVDRICGNGTCNNIPGSYTCNCEFGFQPGWSTPSCQDTDECSQNRNLCAFRCVNIPGGYHCICPRGYNLHADGRHCTDVDECAVKTDNCGFVCKNFVGGFKCICPDGYRRVGRRQCIDIDECREDTGRCTNGVCRNMPGNFICDCNSGYKRSADGKSCEDLSRGLCFSEVDKGMCKGSTHQMMMVTRRDCCCTAGIAWGSQCTRCPEHGTRGVRQLCIGELNEMDECKMISNLCPNGKCINTVGSYRCMCNHGFQLSRDGKSCTDINECAETPKSCLHKCVNTHGSYRCLCPEGYQQRNGQRTCEDIDECANKSHNCQNTCENTMGSYICSCPKGYVQLNGASCVDINECTQRPYVCRFGRCINKPGTYSCLCNQGYRYNPQTKTCTDLNECNVRSCQGTCVNLNGGYRCGCRSGFIRQPYWNQCFDINECRTGANKCGGTQCVNIQGGYRCSCPRGYQLDRIKMRCNDFNECYRNPCSSSGCYNIQGGFQCTCPSGFRPLGGGHCISRFGQTCYNCDLRKRPRKRPESITTGNKYKFGEKPERKATPARQYSSRFSYPENPFRSSRVNSKSSGFTKPADPYRYTYSYESSSGGGRKRRASHSVHKLWMTVSRNLTAHDKLIELTPVLETLQKTFHYEILRGNRNLFRIKLHKGITALHSKKRLKNHRGVHELYLKGRIEETGTQLPAEVKQEIEFSGSGVERKPRNNDNKSTKKNEGALGLSQAKRFHLRLFIDVI